MGTSRKPLVRASCLSRCARQPQGPSFDFILRKKTGCPPQGRHKRQVNSRLTTHPGSYASRGSRRPQPDCDAI